jgi:hypothetical protein
MEVSFMQICFSFSLKTALRVLLTLGLSGVSITAWSAQLPKTPTELAAKSSEDMKSFGDVKVKLGAALTDASLKGKSETELSLMRNSIYAQAGFAFSEAWLKNYFHSRSWYKEGSFSPKALTKVDLDNVKMIYDFQKSHDLLTVYTPVPKPVATKFSMQRKTASDSDSLKMEAAAYKKALMKMRYCNLMMDGTPYYKLTFHHNNVVTYKRLGEDGGNAYNSSYEEGATAYEGEGGGAYSGGEDGAYGSSYEGKSGKAKSTWKIKNGRVVVSIDGDTEFNVGFTKKSITAHECYY